MPRLTARICGLGTAALLLVGDLAAQQPSDPVCLGRGVHLQIRGSGASSGRASASYLVWIDGVSRIMVDAGGGTKDQFHESGAELANIELLALSHFHPDQSAEFPALIWPGGAGIQVSEGVFPSLDGFVDRLFGPNGAFPVLGGRTRLDALTVDVTDNAPTDVWREGNLSVKGVGVPHGDVPTVSYRVDVGDASVAFSSDQNGSDVTFVDFIRDVDMLVIHFCAREDSTGPLHARPSVWGKLATDAGIGHLVISHICAPSSQILQTDLEFLREKYRGPLTVAEDLMCLEVR